MSNFHRTFALFLGLLFFAVASRADPQIIENRPTTLVYPPFWHTPFGIHRGTPDLLAHFVGSRTTLDHPQDLTCNLLLSDLTKQDNTAQFQVTVLGANSGAGHLIYNPSLMQIEVIGDRAAARAWLGHPMGVAMYSDGTTYVSDIQHREVHRLTPVKNRLQYQGPLPPPPQGWKQPWGIALDSQGNVLVSDRERNQLFLFSPDGMWLKTYGPEISPGITLSEPTALAVVDPLEQWSYYHSHAVYILDQAGTRLLRLSGDGRVTAQFSAGQLDQGNTPPAFAWMELDYYENLWVTDTARSQVHKFNRNLHYLTSYGTPGQGDYRFTEPTGIAIHRHFGQVFIAEKFGAHYFWVGTDILNAAVARPAGQENTAQLAFFLTEPSWLTVEVRAPSLHQPLWIMKKQWMDSGQQQILWTVPPGLEKENLEFQLTAEATYSSARYKAKRVQCRLPAISVASRAR